MKFNYRISKINSGLANISMVWIYLMIWHFMAADKLPIIVISWLFSLVLGSLLLGDLLLKWILQDLEKFNNLPTKLLLGFLCFNTVLYIGSLFSPFSLSVNWFLFFLLIVIIWFKERYKKPGKLLSSGNITESIFFIIVPLAITFWCHDGLRPVDFQKGYVVIRAWQDIYYHLCQIGTFASSKGLGTIFDIQMAGAPAHPYHMASYTFSAILIKLSVNSSAIEVYGSLLVPLGILLTLLAAYSLGRSVFGNWPALALSLALILLPDAYQQGFKNPFLSYHWLQQIAPGQGYGIASAAIVFMLLIEACHSNKYRLLVAGYFFTFVTLLFKAQFFVAISYVAFVFPILFMTGRWSKYKIPLLLLCSSVYIGVIILSQKSLSIPTLRLDSSSLITYSDMILNNQENGVIKNLFNILFNISSHNRILRGGSFVLMLTICTLGMFSILYIASLRHLRRYFRPCVWIFPSLIFVNYVVMATGLAFDERRIGMPEELHHRPFTWIYFIFVTWGVGAAYHQVFGDAPPVSSKTRWALLMLSISLLIIPISFGKRIQTYEGWGIGYQKVPECQYKAAKFIKGISHSNDIIQDSSNDPRFIISALSERSLFAIDGGGIRTPKGIELRLNLLEQLKSTYNIQDVELVLKKNNIRFYIVNPGDQITWRESGINHLVFSCGDYRVYQF